MVTDDSDLKKEIALLEQKLEELKAQVALPARTKEQDEDSDDPFGGLSRESLEERERIRREINEHRGRYRRFVANRRSNGKANGKNQGG